MIVGNDISAFQGNINWDVYADNTNFVLIKATEGVGFTDAKFYEYQQQARAYQLPLGYYHFAHPDLGNKPEDEANYFLTTLGNLQEGEVLCLDYEVDFGGDVVSWCKTFLDTIQQKTGIKPFIYLNQDLCQQYDWNPIINANYALWVAAYTGDPNQNTFNGGNWQVAAMQQWTDAQTVPGIIGKVDGDVFFGTISSFKAYGFHQTTPPTSPTSPTNPTPPSEPPDPCIVENAKILLLTQVNGDLRKVNQEYNEQIVSLQTQLIEAKKELFALKNPPKQKVTIDYIQEWIQKLLKGGK